MQAAVNLAQLWMFVSNRVVGNIQKARLHGAGNLSWFQSRQQ